MLGRLGRELTGHMKDPAEAGIVCGTDIHVVAAFTAQEDTGGGPKDDSQG